VERPDTNANLHFRVLIFQSKQRRKTQIGEIKWRKGGEIKKENFSLEAPFLARTTSSSLRDLLPGSIGLTEDPTVRIWARSKGRTLLACDYG